MYYTVYRVTNKVNGKIYVGVHKTNNLDDGYMGSGKYLRRAQEKQGLENFEKEILFVFDNPEEMYAKEAEIVNEDFLSEENTYNLTLGGHGGWYSCNTKEGVENRKHIFSIWQKAGVDAYTRKLNSDEEFRERCRINSKKAIQNINENRKMYLPNGSFFGKTHSEESKLKMSEAASNRTGEKNSQFGTIWITNGNENRKIKKSEVIPEGWEKGRNLK